MQRLSRTAVARLSLLLLTLGCGVLFDHHSVARAADPVPEGWTAQRSPVSGLVGYLAGPNRGVLPIERSEEPLDPVSLSSSPLDGALLCRVKRELCAEGLLARFSHAAQAELLHAVEEVDGRMGLRISGRWRPLPEL